RVRHPANRSRYRSAAVGTSGRSRGGTVSAVMAAQPPTESRRVGDHEMRSGRWQNRPIMPSLPRPVVAIGAGLCLAASLPPWGWWPLAFVGVVLLDRAVFAGPAPLAT